MSELDDRRQRAREATQDACVRAGGLTQDEATAIDIAIETATRVRITPEMVRILANGGASDYQDLREIFELAGFEVES